MTRRGITVLAACALAAAALAGCGESESTASRPLSDKLVNLQGDPPYVNAFDIDPQDGSFLLTTNRGFYRIPKDGSDAVRQRSVVEGAGDSSPVGTFLALMSAGGSELMGSGHPDSKRTRLPQFLGLIRSTDSGRTWKLVSRLGLADLHVMRQAGEKFYAFDAVLGLMLLSLDGGKTWKEHAAPRGALIVDFVVDPADDKHLIAASDDQTFTSADEGKSWRPTEPVLGARFAWPSASNLIRTTQDGKVWRSEDAGRSFREIGQIKGEPWRLKATSDQQLYAALKDGAIVQSSDGGASWEELFTP